MTDKSVRNNIRRVCGAALAAVMAALSGWGCGDPAGYQEGKYDKLILRTGEAWVYTYTNSTLPTGSNGRLTPASVAQSQQHAYIFKGNGKVDRLRYNAGWVMDTSSSISWSTKGDNLTLRYTGGASKDTTFTFSLTGAESEPILTLFVNLGNYWLPPLRGYERREVEVK